VNSRDLIAKSEHAVKSPIWGCQNFISFRKDAGVAKLCGRARNPPTNRKRVQWIQCFGRARVA
jgi:hypothetical protein